MVNSGVFKIRTGNVVSINLLYSEQNVYI